VPALHEIQRALRDCVYSSEQNCSAGTHVRANGLNGARRIAVYRNNTRSSLTGALRAVYPVVCRLVGDGFFDFAADRYITQYPSRYGDLHAYGREFGDFLDRFEPARSLPYLPDVARMEWACHEAYHAADHGPLDFSRLAEITSDRHGSIIFHLHPSARMIVSKYPVLEIWRANQDGNEDRRVDLDSGGIRLLVLRPAYEIEFHPLSTGEFTMLQHLARHHDLETSMPAVLATDHEFNLDACLRRFAQSGVIVDFSISERR